MGQLVPLEQWYFHGVTIGDVAFLGWLAVALIASASFRHEVWAAVRRHWIYLGLLIGVVFMLLLSIYENSGRYQVSVFYILSVVRLGYFLLVGLVVYIWARERSITGLVGAYLLGLTLSVAVTFALSQFPEPERASACTLPVVLNPNVLGNMLGVGILFGSLLVFDRRPIPALVVTPILAVISIFTFSKGTWLMVAFSFVALFVALWVLHKSEVGRTYRRAIGAFAGVLVILALVLHGEALCQLQWKLRAQAANTSISTRFNMMTGVFGATTDDMESWAFGLGVGRLKDVRPDFLGSGGGSGVSSAGNPHSAFLFILASSGFIGLGLFLLAILYPFGHALRRWGWSWPLGGYSLFALLTYVVSGSFELQLYSQYFFWIYAGVLLALVDRGDLMRSAGGGAAARQVPQSLLAA